MNLLSLKQLSSTHLTASVLMHERGMFLNIMRNDRPVM